MYRDYGDQVNFFFVYKALAHPEVNGFVPAFNLKERLAHVQRAKKMLHTTIPWLCDTMQNEFSAAFANVPNGEFVIDPEGVLVRKRFWSNADTLRMDLEELVGKSESTTSVDDLEVVFKPEPRKVASGVVPRLELPRGLMALKYKPVDIGEPFFAKLRVEGTPSLRSGQGKLYFGVYLDPIYEVHWNNRAGKVTLGLEADGVLELEEKSFTSDEVDEDADVDPRQFLVPAKVAQQGGTFIASITYTVCDDAETFCKTFTQQYEVTLVPDRKLGTRPGIFLFSMFKDVREHDKNEDGKLTVDELPPGKVSMYVGHMDYDGNNVIDFEEIDRFMKMFNEGRGILTEDDGK